MNVPPVAMTRKESLDRLENDALDLLVVGGGIVGAGIARDAALRGLRTAVVEQHDVAFGTSSRSSRLLHGGLRYLAQGRLGLVYEASREKRVLHRIASHVAEPLPFLFPTYSGTPWARWKLAVGVKLYDVLCGGSNLGPSSAMGQAAMRARLPGLNTTNLTGGVRYYDALTNDARLVIDTLRSAARHGAAVLNYLKADAIEPGDQGAWRCMATDVANRRSLTIHARTIVNATGPWPSLAPASRLHLRLTKGVHLVIDRQRLSVPDAVVLAEGNRILFAIPWGERVILGTTDTDYSGLPEQVRTEADDVSYVLEVVNRAFPQVAITPSDVISDWAGLRPLLADPRGGPSDISRRHDIIATRPGVWEVAGGKLTTYRLIAEQAVDCVELYLGHRSRSRTAEQPLLGGPDASGSGILPPPIGQAVVEHACREEWTEHLVDLMLRRTGWHYYLPARAEVAIQAAGWMASSLGWDAARQEAELAEYRRLIGA